MRIWVDADACPGGIRDILFRAADRLRIALTLVANKPLRTPPSPWIRAIQVPAGFDAADERIAGEVMAGDLVITADIPLAAAVIDRGGLVLDPRGERLTGENIGERLALRGFMDELRSSGVQTGGPAPFSARDQKAFADQLDRLLQRHAAGSNGAKGGGPA